MFNSAKAFLMAKLDILDCDIILQVDPSAAATFDIPKRLYADGGIFCLGDCDGARLNAYGT
jgi:hypothetical protein